MSESIPEGWEIKKLGEIGRFSTSSVDKKVNTNEKTVNLLNYMDIYNNSTLDNQYSFQLVTANQKQISSSNVLSGDIFFTPSSENPDDIGHSAVFVGDIKNLVHSYHTIRYRTYSSEEFEEAFKAYAFKSNETYLYFRKMAQGSTRFTLSLPAFEELQILIPTIPEQKKIASILTSVDEVIVKTQSQIEKLQDLKKGMMNELLTKGIGHTEFKDSELGRIPKNWTINNLKKFCKKVDKKYHGNNHIPVLSVTKHAGFVNSLEYFKKQVFSKDLKSYKLVAKGQFAYATIHLDEGSLGLLKEYDFGLISPMYTVFETNDDINNDYLFMLMKSDIFMKKYHTIGQGSIDRRMTISFDSLSQLKMCFPTLKEQNEIVRITNQINKNINLSIKKLNQTQSLKKSLMQDLLTGKVRVQVK